MLSHNGARLFSLAVPNFLVTSQKVTHNIVCHGSEQDIRNFARVATQGLKQQLTSRIDQPSLLHALEISLRAAHKNGGRAIPSFEVLRNAFHSREYKDLVELISMGTSRDWKEQHFFSQGNLVIEVAQILLHILGREVNEAYEIKYLTEDIRTRDFVLYSLSPLDNASPTRIVWLINQLADLNSRHWSAMVPSDGSRSSQDNRPKKSVRVSRKPSQRSWEYRDGIADAPPANTELPYYAMQGITTRELLTFFPNHSLRWPAICARIMAERWPFSEISKYVNRSRNIADDASEDSKALIPNSVRSGLLRGDELFLTHQVNRPYERNTATEKELESYKWTPVEYRKSGSLEPAWSLREIAETFPNLNAINCAGDFTMKILTEWEGLKNGFPEIYPAPVSSAERGLSNPPQLPAGWKSGVSETESLFKAVPDSHLGHKDSDILKKAQIGDDKLVKGARTKVDWCAIIEKERRDSDAIIDKYPTQLAGELLLWVLSKKGGNKTIQEIFERLKGNPREIRGYKPLTRSTISWRQKSALNDRARINGTSYEHEFTKFKEDEACHRGPRRHYSFRSNPATSRSQARSRPQTIGFGSTTGFVSDSIEAPSFGFGVAEEPLGMQTTFPSSNNDNNNFTALNLSYTTHDDHQHPYYLPYMLSHHQSDAMMVDNCFGDGATLPESFESTEHPVGTMGDDRNNMFNSFQGTENIDPALLADSWVMENDNSNNID